MNKRLEDLINPYLEAHEELWAYSTWRSTKYRLRALGPHLGKTPDEMYNHMVRQELGAYTIQTNLSILSSFYSWLVEGDHVPGNPYAQFKKKLNRTGRGRNAYKKRVVPLTYDSALRALSSIQDKTTRKHAIFLLRSGLRIAEAYTVEQIGEEYYVLGKGNKRRRIYAKPPLNFSDENTLRTALREVAGLKPHDLRKLFATRLVSKGVALQDVCEIMGWNSIATAQKYLQVSSQGALAAAVRDAL